MTNQEMFESTIRVLLTYARIPSDSVDVKQLAGVLAREMGVKIDERSGEAIVMADGLIMNLRLSSTLSAVAFNVSDLTTCNVACIGQGE